MTSANSAMPEGAQPVADTIDAESLSTIWRTNFTKTNQNLLANNIDNLLTQNITSWGSMHPNNNNNNNDQEMPHPADEYVDSDASNTRNRDAMGSPPSPSHHARRPMNAFLIFCKKHRPIVRENFPSIENRSVTRILGEWWAFMDIKEREPYTCLAKEFKDAFFNEHPGFRWYKLPAPPLRTIPSRPGKPERTNPAMLPSSVNCTPAADFTPGKLADETQLGLLSSLFPSPSNISTEQAAKPLKKRLLQHYNTESSTSVHDSDMDQDGEPNGRKSVRKGKGNRYAHIMANGKLFRNKRQSSEKMTDSEKVPEGGKLDLNLTIKRLEQRISQPKLEENTFEECERKRSVSEMSETSETFYDYSNVLPSFKLNERIAHLPCMQYDIYVQRKKDSKKRKTPKCYKRKAYVRKIEGKIEERKLLTRNQVGLKKIVVENVEKQTGSKKRKNKRNITHLESNRLVSTCVDDLSGLETLAEIAAEKEKINASNEITELGC